MADNNPHLFLTNLAIEYNYQPRQGFSSDNIPERNRDLHSDKLILDYLNAENANIQFRNERQENQLPLRGGSYWEFTGKEGYDLITKSLEDLNKNVRLLNIKTNGDTPENTTIKAVLFVPQNEEQIFRKKIIDYKFKNTKAGNPKNAPLVQSIEYISLANILSLWTDKPDLIPENEPQWCEIWFYLGDNFEILNQSIQTSCEIIDIQISTQILKFPERIVYLIRANRDQIVELINQCDFIAEIKLLKETAKFWLNESNVDQVQWVEDLLQRTSFVFAHDIGICVLDTGINNGHQLLNPVLHNSDRHSVNPTWGVNDHDGHGTLMAGIATYGDLQLILESQEKFEVNHKISSVKVLPPTGENDKELYGAITFQGVSRSEIAAPDRTQLFAMAVTSEEKIFRGRPTSWSSTIDQISFGSFDGKKRLMILSAGNVRDEVEFQNYPNSNISISVEDPAQSWNALTIGAVTDKTIITDGSYNGHNPIADVGELSPYSSTSTNWERKKWPLKPDIVLEGGNILKAPDNSIVGTIDDYSILSTSKRPSNTQFDAFWGTSAATAYGAWMCAKILSYYPQAWPETVRGLIIHSAEWTNALINQFSIDLTKKSAISNLMRICGYGVPNLNKAIQNTQSSFTLISEEEIKPFTINEDGRVIAKDMHFYKLPWPKELLLGLGETKVKFRITLSYFIEPAPGEVGWKDRYRYQSFGFRFEVNTPTDTEEEFLARVNLALRDEDEIIETNNNSDRWLIGANLRNLGSVHSDIWEATAAEISTCNFIAIYPVIGWWKERKYLEKWKEKARYSLLISLETPIQEIDIYSPIYKLIATPISVPISNKVNSQNNLNR
ncbi:MAG: S8 family peptidase [Sphingobacteriia bacterium]|nr:S8 family peptidase [Sphingobacteriia bacterium]